MCSSKIYVKIVISLLRKICVVEIYDNIANFLAFFFGFHTFFKVDKFGLNMGVVKNCLFTDMSSYRLYQTSSVPQNQLFLHSNQTQDPFLNPLIKGFQYVNLKISHPS